jgi:hypothetical protein
VDRYLDGVMSTEERNWFEKELQDDMYLKKELELQEKIHETLAMKDIIDLERQLNTIYQDTYRPWVKTIRLTGNVKKVVAFATGIAAAVCLIIIGVINFSSGPTSSTDLYNTYYKPAEMNMSFRTAEDMVDGDLRSAMILYENKEYDDAIALFEKIIKTDETRIGLHLY